MSIKLKNIFRIFNKLLPEEKEARYEVRESRFLNLTETEIEAISEHFIDKGGLILDDAIEEKDKELRDKYLLYVQFCKEESDYFRSILLHKQIKEKQKIEEEKLKQK